MKVEVNIIPYSERIWEQVASLLLKVDYEWKPYLNLEDFKTRLEEGSFHMVGVLEKDELTFVHILEFEYFPNCTVLNAVYATGKDIVAFHGKQEQLLAKKVELAKRENAKYIRIRGRPGWKHILERDGYKPKFVTFIKEINNGDCND